jgi:hypothetical protein
MGLNANPHTSPHPLEAKIVLLHNWHLLILEGTLYTVLGAHTLSATPISISYVTDKKFDLDQKYL